MPQSYSPLFSLPSSAIPHYLEQQKQYHNNHKALNYDNYLGYCCKCYDGAPLSDHWDLFFLEMAYKWQKKGIDSAPWIASALVDVKAVTDWRKPQQLKQVFATWYIGPNEPELCKLDLGTIDTKIRTFLARIKWVQLGKYRHWKSCHVSQRFRHKFTCSDLVGTVSDSEDDEDDSHNGQTTPGHSGEVSGNKQKETGKNIAEVREQSQGALQRAAHKRGLSNPLKVLRWADQDAIPDECKLRDGYVIEIIATTEYQGYTTLPLHSRWWITEEAVSGVIDEDTSGPKWVWPGMRADVDGASEPQWIPTDNGRWVEANQKEKGWQQTCYTSVANRHRDEQHGLLVEATSNKSQSNGDFHLQ